MTCAVIPRGDLVDHDDFSEDCLCGPQLVLEPTDHGDEGIIVHEALDGRQ